MSKNKKKNENISIVVFISANIKKPEKFSGLFTLYYSIILEVL